MERAQIGTGWQLASTSTGSASIPLPARTITAGSVVVCRWRYEGGAPALQSFSDGTAAAWVTAEYGTNPTVGYAVCLNHPGGTNLVGTVTLSASRTYRAAYGVEYEGGGALIDATPAGVSGSPQNISFTASAAGICFIATGSFSASNVTPTAPAVTEQNHQYSSYWRKVHASPGAQSAQGSGAAGNTVTLAVVIRDNVSSGNPPTWSATPANMSAIRGQALTPQDIHLMASDPEGDTLTFALVGAPAGVTIGGSTGIISGTPTAAPGVYTVQATVSDGNNLPVSSSNFTITVVAAILPFSLDANRLGIFSGSSAAAAGSAQVVVEVWQHAATRASLVVRSGTLTSDANGFLADYSHASLSYGTTYRVDINQAAAPWGSCSTIMTAT